MTPPAEPKAETTTTEEPAPTALVAAHLDKEPETKKAEEPAASAAPVAAEKKKLKADGKLDKFGRPNAETPSKWTAGYKDYSAPAEEDTKMEDGSVKAEDAPAAVSAPTPTKSEPEAEDDGADKKKRKKHEGETAEEKAERKKRKKEKKEKKAAKAAKAGDSDSD